MAEKVQGERNGPSTRSAVIAGAGVVIILALAYFAASVVAPLFGTHSVLGRVKYGEHTYVLYADMIPDLGGPERAAHRLTSYAHLPDWAAPRKEAAFFLLGHCGEPAVPELIPFLHHKDPEVRSWAASALWQMGPLAAGATSALVCSLGDTESSVRGCAALALGKIGAPAGQAVPALVERLEDPDEGVRRAAAEALRKIRGWATPDEKPKDEEAQ